MTVDEQIRLECMKMAIARLDENPVMAAQAYYNFIVDKRSDTESKKKAA